MYSIRRAKIIDFITGKQFVSIRELREICPEITLMTLHRDLDTLVRDGVIIKLRGGVRVMGYSGDPSFQSREYLNTESKLIIAKKAIELIHEGGSVFFDAGTTTLAVIRAMPDVNITVITNGANFSNELARFANVTTYVCCGVLNHSNMALSGNSTLEFLDGINIDLGFIGVSGYTEDSGFTCGKESEMLVKRLVIQKARKSIALMDTTKMTRLMPYTFAKLADVDYVIGDGDMPDSFLKSAGETGVTVL